MSHWIGGLRSTPHSKACRSEPKIHGRDSRVHEGSNVLQVHPPITARSGEAPPAKVLIQIRHVNGDGVSDVLRRRAAPKSSWIAVPWAVGRKAAPAG
ncbi:MAG TPA: hypothetical protein VN130_07595, partial [Xanthobacteraceae bacterium]|nr:hypothetical protein [Xanthobacteraceae bacterium]